MAVPALVFTIFLGCHFCSHALRISSKQLHHQRPHRWGRYHYHAHRSRIQIPPKVDVLPKDNTGLLGAQCNWGGLNSYFLYAQEEHVQHETLNAMREGGLKMLRIFVGTVPANHKHTKSQFVNFLEPDHMGPPYQTQVLELINDLMAKAHDYGVKLAIAMHDRYSLGCYACDGYQKQLGLFCAPAHREKCGPLNDASKFYTDPAAIFYYDQRLEFILNYQNPHFSNKRWGELKEVVAMFEVQNEAHGFDPLPWPNNWHCDRAKVMRPLMDPAIFIGTGGGRTFKESTLIEHFSCSDIDVVTLHDYDASSWLEIYDNLTNVKKLSVTQGKKILYEEFGNKKHWYRPDYYYAIVTAANLNGVPFMPWEFLIPPSTDDRDFEFDTHQASYPVLVYGVLVANRTAAAHRWSNLELCDVHG